MLCLPQVKFSADGNYLYTGARKDPEILCWDVRYTSDVVYRLQRDTADTNQRIQFDIEPMGRHLTTGLSQQHGNDCLQMIPENTVLM